MVSALTSVAVLALLGALWSLGVYWHGRAAGLREARAVVRYEAFEDER